jgi:AcrR family transcriptional regulator
MMAKRPRKRRDLAATRAAVVRAARICFSEDSYDHVSLRRIAGLAGVDVAMVARAFGSKEALYREAVVTMFHFPEEFTRLARQEIVDALIDWLLQPPPSKEFNINLAMIRSASVSPARELLREGLEERFATPLSKVLDGPEAGLRSELISAISLGLLTLKAVVGTSSLHAADPSQLHRLLRPIFLALIEPETEINNKR